MTRALVFRSTQVAIDVVVLSVALWAACVLRFEADIPPHFVKKMVLLWPYVVGLQYLLLTVFGVPRFSWRYVGLREVTRIALAVSCSTVVLALARIFGGTMLDEARGAKYVYLPFGVIGIDSALTFIGLVGVRVARRLTSEQGEVRRLRPSREAVPTLLVGAGRSGVMVAKEIASRPELGIAPMGFIDDDAMKHGSVVHGLEVLGATSEIARIAKEKNVRQAIITIANAPGRTVRSIAEACHKAGLQVKIVPGLYQLVGGELNLTRLRDVAIEDLLRREPVVLDHGTISADLANRSVLVTGAGGSIGSELCRQVARFGPERLILYERTENALFEIHRELLSNFPNLQMVPCVGDICDRARLEQVFAEHRPEVVYHAAAHKHVPMMEWNPGEAVKNNVHGTRLVADVSRGRGVRAFVMISTDKAVNPTSVMGATKRIAEIYVQALAQVSTTRFVTVRFGNVLGSNGSVIPIFKEQIAKGGPVTITHPEMQRYFMTIPEACQLVLKAGAMGRGGEIFILDMGEPVKIVDLARDLIRLSGLEPDEMEIAFTGLRPGEKLFEELSTRSEDVDKTRDPKIFIGKTRPEPLESVSARIDALLATGSNPEDIRAGLAALVPEYKWESRASSARGEAAE